MDRGEQALPAVQPNVPAAVEGSQQQPQAPPAGQASGSQQPQQAIQSQPQQRSPESTQAGPLVAIRLPPPTPAKTERDLTFRASRPVSRSISPPTDGYEDASDARVESPQPQPIRLSSVPLIQSPEVARSRDGGHGSRGNLVYDIPPAGIPPPGNPPRRRRGSAAMDWVIPDREVASVYIPRPRTAGERLQPTLDHARLEKAKYERKAWMNGYALNMAIGLQVILGALVTGLSAAVSANRVGITTAILGGASTLVASYLARMRGSNEPELSITRTKDLNQFIRECDAFQMDYGHITGTGQDAQLEEFRRRFEELLGNANGERKLSPV